MTTLSIERDDLLQRWKAIAPYIHRTPLWRSSTLSQMTGCEVWLKCELFQKTGSYKPRGMLAKLIALETEAAARGVVTFSAGNAAQALAYAGGILDISTTLVMPATASTLKVEAARGYGGQVILHGDPRECFAKAQELASERDLEFVSSYDDMDLMAGHASAGLEILEDLPEVGAIFVGVGGGGMIGGISLALEAANHHARLIGVEPEGAAAMAQSFKEGRAVTLDRVQSIADGLAAPSTGVHCFEIARRRVEEILVVVDSEIRDAMVSLMVRTKLYAEPAGAASLAGLFAAHDRLRSNAPVVVMVSGGNLDPHLLPDILP